MLAEIKAATQTKTQNHNVQEESCYFGLDSWAREVHPEYHLRIYQAQC